MQQIKIDFDNPGLPQRLDVVENDAQSRFFKAVLYKDGKAYTAPSGATYSIMYRGFGPQNEGWYDTINDGAGKRAACSVSGNVVTCEIARQALRVPGHVSVVLCVTGSNGYMLHGWPIDCNCRNDSYTNGTSVESFFYITQVTNADWTQAIQAWENLKDAIDPTLTLSGKAADAAKVGEAVNAEIERAKGVESQIKEDLDNKQQLIPYKDLNQIKKNKKTGIAILHENKPINVVFDGYAKNIYGRNRFNLSDTVLSLSSYTNAHEIIKQNGGFEIICNVTSATSNVYAICTYIAEFDGHIVVSCDADCTGNVADLLLKIKKGNTAIVDSCAGRGHYTLGVDVKKDDLITLLFYTSNKNPNKNTLYYNNIMIAYDGFYDYCDYVPNIVQKYTTKTFTIPNDANLMTNHSVTSGGYYVTINNSIDNMRNYPESTYIIPDVTVDGATLCQISNTSTTVGLISKTSGVWVSINPLGIVYINIDTLGKFSVAEYLQTHPITITYETEELEKTNPEIDNHTYQEGEIIELDSDASVTYEFTPEIKKKKLVCFGDSITGMFESDSSYPDMISRMSNIDAINVGFAGCCMADHRTDKYVPYCMNRLADAITSGDYSTQDAQAESIGGYYPLHVSRLKKIDWKAVDYISIFYGTNDWGMNKIMLSGKETDKSICTQDALKYTIETISRIYPWIKIVVIAPYWRSKSADFDSNKNANDNGDYLYQFSDMIVSTAEEYNLPSINLYRNLGANVYTNRYFTKDGTHPTEMCKEIIAKRLIECIGLY